ncbi:CoB--CoM heterodisulfide reductase iron-sulfur subunit B family protein [bacterium]|nr:CoB--CoM heterodisulfide reductase iron-sulfur subunit B family protein [bacterium]MCB2201978.1 CoB--CoM heterodisulfide reductase iron-sulfur subunit B family protein [bacterium]
MKISYYPGCTLKTKARNLEDSALACMDALGIDYEELPRWNCCGAVYSLSDDDLIHLIAPVRDLIRAKERGADTVMTLCSMCYNTLARANRLMAEDEEKRYTINQFMDEEPDYSGELKVVHFLDFLRDTYGWDALKAKVTTPLTDLKVAPYYGCTLVRPKEVAIDRPDNPHVLQDFLTALGATPVDFPSSIECCGAYQVLGNPGQALKLSHGIIEDARAHGAEALAIACPLCDYNLGRRQEAMLKTIEGAEEMPVYYFTQLLAVALGVSPEAARLDMNRDNALELLTTKQFVPTKSA